MGDEESDLLNSNLEDDMLLNSNSKINMLDDPINDDDFNVPLDGPTADRITP